MATLVTKIDRQVGNYQSTFLYTIYASFNGIVGEIEDASIRIFVPDWFEVTIGEQSGEILAVTEEVGVEGKTILFQLGAITDLGVSITIGFGLQFTRGIPTGTSYTAVPQLWVNGSLYQEESGDTIRLEVNPNFIVAQERILPVIAPASGSQMYYRVTIENIGDIGGVLNEFEVFCSGSNGFILDETFPVLGEDVSDIGNEDTAQDGTEGDIENNRLSFFLEQYQGQRYQFIYRAILSDDLQLGESVTAVLSYTIDEIPKNDTVSTFTVSEGVFDGTISLYGPRFTLPSSPINYSVSIENKGNQPLTAVNLLHNLPEEITFNSLVTGRLHIGAIDQEIVVDYELFYITSNGRTGSLGMFNTNISQRVSLEDVLESGESLVSLSLDLSALGVGVSTKSGFLLDGVVNQDVSLNTTIVKADALTWAGGTDDASKSTLVSNTCALLPIGGVSPNGQYAKIGDTIRYTIGANCNQSRLLQPVVATLLPKELTYLGNITAQYTSYFQEEEPITPQVTLIENATAEGETLVQFSFIGGYSHEFFQKSTLRISFDTQVNIGALGDFSSSVLLYTVGSTPHYPSSVIQYQGGSWGGTGTGYTYAKRYEYWKTVLFFASITSDKKIKGQLDSQYSEEPQVGQSTQGGWVDYLITITNNGNGTLDSIEVIDILPHMGDTGVILTESNRNSQFPIYLSGEVVALQLPSYQKIPCDIYYSTSTNPLRFGGQFNMIGEETRWSTTLPLDLTAIRSIKVKTKHTQLLPNQSILIGFRGTIPVGTEAELIAWNSFGADVVYTTPQGVQTHLLAVEGEKVGVQVVAPIAGTGAIGGFAFLDQNEDGYFEEGNPLVNDIGVILYDENSAPIATTFTGPDAQGTAGYFLFTNLPKGRYFIRFLVDEGHYHFTKQRNTVWGSYANIETGYTKYIEITDTNNQHTISVGLVAHNPIDALLKVNHSARSTVRTVLYNQMIIGSKMDDLIELIEETQ